MIKVNGLHNESLVLDGEWFEKLRAGEPKAKLPASSFKSAEVTEIERRKKLFGGEKEQLIQVMLTFEEPPFIGFTVAEPRSARELDALLGALEAARS